MKTNPSKLKALGLSLCLLLGAYGFSVGEQAHVPLGCTNESAMLAVGSALETANGTDVADLVFDEMTRAGLCGTFNGQYAPVVLNKKVYSGLMKGTTVVFEVWAVSINGPPSLEHYYFYTLLFIHKGASPA